MVRLAMALVLGLSACGGKVVFVEEDGNSGGNGFGGSSSSVPSQGGSTVTTTPIPTTATSTSSSGGSTTISCETFDCSIGQTFCSCLGECSVCQGDFCTGGTAEQVCSTSPQGMACQCIFGGELIGECSQVNGDCALESGCCLAMFQSALQ
jgi:hypothetical protein